MKKLLVFLSLALLSSAAYTQRLHAGVFGGLSAYNGDLTEKIFPQKVTNFAIGVSVNYEVTDRIMARLGLTYTVVGGADKYSGNTDTYTRNLSFETKITEAAVTGEYYLYSLDERRFSPYLLAGIAVYHFNPYTYDATKSMVYLKPLSTEGQGITGYPDRKPYSLTQFAIPFGAGLKFAINDNLRIGLEGGMRKLFTDYLDDVSTSYIDAGDLLAAKGQLAIDLSYRGDEAGGSLIYPAKNAQRGSPKSKDYYYFTGIHLTYRLGTSSGGSGGGRHKTGCPVNIW